MKLGDSLITHIVAQDHGFVDAHHSYIGNDILSQRLVLGFGFPGLQSGFPGGSEVKASAWNVGDPGLIPELGSSPGEGHGNPLQYSCLENPMDRGAWQATVHGVAKSQTQGQSHSDLQ